MSTHTFQDQSLVIQLMMWLYIFCVRLLHKNQHRLKELSLFCQIHKGQFDIDGSPSFLELFYNMKPRSLSFLSP